MHFLTDSKKVCALREVLLAANRCCDDDGIVTHYNDVFIHSVFLASPYARFWIQNSIVSKLMDTADSLAFVAERDYLKDTANMAIVVSDMAKRFATKVEHLPNGTIINIRPDERIHVVGDEYKPGDAPNHYVGLRVKMCELIAERACAVINRATRPAQNAKIGFTTAHK